MYLSDLWMSRGEASVSEYWNACWELDFILEWIRHSLASMKAGAPNKWHQKYLWCRAIGKFSFKPRWDQSQELLRLGLGFSLIIYIEVVYAQPMSVNFYLDTYLNSVFWKTCMRRRQSLDSTRFSLYFCVIILTDIRKSEIRLDNMLFNLKDPFRCIL